MLEGSGRVGLALGSGAARGWAHIGVIRTLEEAGIRPEIVVGSSMGAVVGALYASGRLDDFESWGRALQWKDVVGYLDLSFRGGLIRARRVFDYLASALPDQQVEELAPRFAAVATDLESGQEVWLREGSLVDVLRASTALPGLVAPVAVEGRWLVDGGLVNPVPVSLCRALGADTVVAVDLNTTLLRRRLPRNEASPVPPASPPPELVDASDSAPPGRALVDTVQGFLGELRKRLGADESGPGRTREVAPSIYEVVANSINIMQMRISRSRMAGDPPDLLVTPRLGDFGLLDFERAEEAIEEGRRAVLQALAGAPAPDSAGG